MEARFGIRAHIKNFFPPGAVMYVYINEQLRAKGEDHGEVLYWCDRPESGGGGLGFCPRRCTVYTRRHFNVDPRFVYGMCVGGKFEQALKLHSKARRWSEKDARALTDDRYCDNLLEHMMRQGLAHLSPHEVEQRQELVKQAIELMGSDDRMQLVSEVVEKRMKQLGNGDNADSERVGGAEAAEAPPRRSSRERATQKTTRQWNPITKEYEQVKATLTAASTGYGVMAATIRIFDTYSGTGTTTTVAAEVSRITGIRLSVVAISEIDKVLRERLQRRQHYEKVFGDISDITKGDVPPHHIYDGSVTTMPRFLNHRSSKRTRRQAFEIIPDDTEDLEVVQTTTAMHGGGDGISDLE